jgi:hypothetical protein
MINSRKADWVGRNPTKKTKKTIGLETGLFSKLQTSAKLKKVMTVRS